MTSCSLSFSTSTTPPGWSESQESSKVKASIERALSPSAAKASIWNYSIQDICVLEGSLKVIKLEEGKDSERYLALKDAVDTLRMARLPFRTYVRWKQKCREVRWDDFKGSCFFPPRGEKKSQFKQMLLEAAAPQQIQDNLKLLSRITFFHGTSSASLIMMLLTDGMLRWVGNMFSLGIAPMYGELGRGVGHRGVNLRGVSTETARGIWKILIYVGMKPFKIDKLSHLHEPLQLLSVENRACLKAWKANDPQGYWSVLSPGMPKTEELINAFCFHIERSQESAEVSLTTKDEDLNYAEYRLKSSADLLTFAHCLSTGEDFPDEEIMVPEKIWTDYREMICNPYILLSDNQIWTKRAIELLQLKQWDPSAFMEQIVPRREEWLRCLEKERSKHEIPLQQIIALIEHEFSIEEISFLRNHRHPIISRFNALWSWAFGEPSFPQTLRSIFPSLEAIPRYNSDSVEYLAGVHENIEHYRENEQPEWGTQYKWSKLFETILKVKIGELNDEIDLQGLLPLLRKELSMIESDYRPLYEALMNDTPTLCIPPDEKTRSLITDPIPLIYASTTVTPQPHEGRTPPDEYLLVNPIPLGRGGIDIIFTDTEESKERLRTILPPHLREEIEIHLLSELEVDGIPLIHAPYQIEPTQTK